MYSGCGWLRKAAPAFAWPQTRQACGQNGFIGGPCLIVIFLNGLLVNRNAFHADAEYREHQNE